MIESGRLASRSVTFGGLAVSLIANLLHAKLLEKAESTDYVVMVGSALPPLFLLGAVEVVLNVRWKPGFWSWLVRILLLPIAGISFYISWLHMSEVVRSWGASDTEAFLYPIMIDVAMLLAAGAMILEDRTPGADRSEGSAGKGPAVARALAEAGPASVLIVDEPKVPRSAPDPLIGHPVSIEIREPDPQDRTAQPVPDPYDETPVPWVPRAGGPAHRTPVADLRPPAPAGSSRVEQLLPIARPMVAAEPGIGWKPLAAKLRDAGHPVGTKTARDLRAALTDDEEREEVSTDAQGDDLHEGRDQEGLVRV